MEKWLLQADLSIVLRGAWAGGIEPFERGEGRDFMSLSNIFELRVSWVPEKAGSVSLLWVSRVLSGLVLGGPAVSDTLVSPDSSVPKLDVLLALFDRHDSSTDLNRSDKISC